MLWGMDREEIIVLATRIDKMRAEIGRLSVMQKELRQLEAQFDLAIGIAQPTTLNSEVSSLEDKVLALLGSDSGKIWTADSISEELASKVPSIRSTLSRLRKDGKIRKAGHGYYQGLAPLLDLAPEQEEDPQIAA